MRQERLMILEKVLSELPGYLGWMIGSCRFSFGKEAGGNTPGQMQHSCDLTVLRSDARLAEVEIRNLTTPTTRARGSSREPPHRAGSQNRMYSPASRAGLFRQK